MSPEWGAVSNRQGGIHKWCQRWGEEGSYNSNLVLRKNTETLDKGEGDLKTPQFMDVPKRNSKAQAATCYTTMTIDPNPISIPYIPE